MNNAHKRLDAVIIGDILADNIFWVEKLPSSGEDVGIEHYFRYSGGSAANTCCVLSELGAKCAFCGSVGNDGLGQELMAALAQRGVELECLQIKEEKTGFTYTMVEPDGERTMLSYRGASALAMQFTPEVKDAVENTKVVYISGYLLSVKAQAEFAIKVAGAARAAGAVVMLDTAPVIGSVERDILERMLECTDVLMPNLRELSLLSGEENAQAGIEKILEKLPVLVVKMGSRGSCLAVRSGCRTRGFETDESFILTSLGEQVKVLDTTGAGDSYNAGFIAAYLKGEPQLDCLKAGNIIAAQVISGQRPRGIKL